MATRTVYLVRHGHYDLDEQSDRFRRLTPQGVKQAKLTAKRLRSVPVTALYSSDLTRAVETAQIIHDALDGIPHVTRRNLRELLPGVPSHLTGHSAFARIPAEAIRAGEERAASVFTRYLRPTRGNDKHEVLVCHGNLIRYLVSRIMDGSGNGWARLWTTQCGISQVVVKSDGGLRVVSYNDIGHLPHSLLAD